MEATAATKRLKKILEEHEERMQDMFINALACATQSLSSKKILNPSINN
jgi:hypothetical protein